MKKVFYNGKIYTSDKNNKWADTIVINNGVIENVGKNINLSDYKNDDYEFVDLENRFVMPGIYDMHTHPDLALAPKYNNNLHVGLENPTPEELKKSILEYTKNHPEKTWVYGTYWVSHTFRKAGIKPGKEWLDSFIPDKPVAILDRMWGNMMVNSKALEVANIDNQTPDPNNGYIVRDPVTKEAEGLLVDGAYAIISAAMPPIETPVLYKAYKDVVHYQATRGVVASKYVHVCENRLDALKKLDNEKKLTQRIEASISWQDDIFPVKKRWELMAGLRHFYRSNRLNANSVKFHFDGTAEAFSSYLVTPWDSDSDWKGKINLTPEHLLDMLVDLDRKKIRIIAHCTGDGASEIFLNAVEKLREINGNGIRHQCAHCTILSDKNLKRFKELNVTAEFSPVGWFPDPFSSKARGTYGKERLKRAYNISGVLKEKGNVVMGTDFPVSSINPWIGFETMITRQNPWGVMEGTFGKKINLEQAIDVMTINGAKAMEIENIAGSIEKGKSADFIILDKNLFEIEPKGNINNVKVLQTYLEGQLVFDHNNSEGAIWKNNAPKF